MAKRYWKSKPAYARIPVQRKSETRRYGHTEYESKVWLACNQMGITTFTDFVVCFECKKFFVNPTKYRFPNRCQLCNIPFKSLRQYCTPDLMVQDPVTGKIRAIIYVNGRVHYDKPKVTAKDKFQIKTLKEIGFKVFTITNEEIDSLKWSNLCFIVYGYFMSLCNEQDKLAYEKEKELVH